MAEALGPKASAAIADVRSSESFEAFAAHAPYALESEKYNLLELVKRLRSENR